MTVIIDDERNATKIRIENVVQLKNTWGHGANGRPCKAWKVITTEGTRTFKQAYYSIDRIEQ